MFYLCYEIGDYEDHENRMEPYQALEEAQAAANDLDGIEYTIIQGEVIAEGTSAAKPQPARVRDDSEIGKLIYSTLRSLGRLKLQDVISDVQKATSLRELLRKPSTAQGGAVNWKTACDEGKTTVPE